jgi:hypothetical protein
MNGQWYHLLARTPRIGFGSLGSRCVWDGIIRICAPAVLPGMLHAAWIAIRIEMLAGHVVVVQCAERQVVDVEPDLAAPAPGGGVINTALYFLYIELEATDATTYAAGSVRYRTFVKS